MDMFWEKKRKTKNGAKEKTFSWWWHSKVSRFSFVRQSIKLLINVQKACLGWASIYYVAVLWYFWGRAFSLTWTAWKRMVTFEGEKCFPLFNWCQWRNQFTDICEKNILINSFYVHTWKCNCVAVCFFFLFLYASMQVHNIKIGSCMIWMLRF
jgi:hypothetical protein